MTLVAATATALAASPAPIRENTTTRLPPNSNPPTHQHMADVVTAAVLASKSGQRQSSLLSLLSIEFFFLSF